jgi:hypothetical protein
VYVCVIHLFAFAGRIVEQQLMHAEAKRELLASRSFKVSMSGAPSAGLGGPQVHAASVEHSRLVIQLCPPVLRHVHCSCYRYFFVI